MSSLISSSSSDGSPPNSPNGLSPQHNGGMKAVGSPHQVDIKGLQKPGKAQQSPAIRDDNAELKGDFDDLSIKFGEVQGDLQASREEVEVLQKELKASREEVKRLQEQDFVLRSQDGVEPHDKVSQQFLDVFRMSTDWARDYFKIEGKLFCLDDHETFKKHLRMVSWDENFVVGKKKLNVRFLVEAVVANVIARRILLCPFEACAGGIRETFGLFYEEMLKGNKSEAHKWRAMTLAGYENFRGWPPSPATSQTIIEHRKNYYKEIAQEIDSIVGSIAQKHFPKRGDHDERLRRSMAFIEAAGTLALKLGKQAAELRIIDKFWFESSTRVFDRNDDRMKGRFAEEDEEDGENYEVDVILRPGFLKYGNDEGENFERCSVWVPTILDLSIAAAKPEISDQTGTKVRDLENNITIPESQTEQSPLSSHHEKPTEDRGKRQKLVEWWRENWRGWLLYFVLFYGLCWLPTSVWELRVVFDFDWGRGVAYFWPEWISPEKLWAIYKVLSRSFC